MSVILSVLPSCSGLVALGTSKNILSLNTFLLIVLIVSIVLHVLYLLLFFGYAKNNPRRTENLKIFWFGVHYIMVPFTVIAFVFVMDSQKKYLFNFPSVFFFFVFMFTLYMIILAILLLIYICHHRFYDS